MALENTQLDEALEILFKVLDNTITDKRKKILLFLAVNQDFTSVTAAVKAASESTGFAESTIWDSVAFFEKTQILRRNGGRLTITKTGIYYIKTLESGRI